MGDEILRELGVTLPTAIATVISSAGMYATLSLILKLWGDKLRTSTSTATIAVMALLGAIAARSTLGMTPTFASGLIAITTILLMERLFGMTSKIGHTIWRREVHMPKRMTMRRRMRKSGERTS